MHENRQKVNKKKNEYNIALTAIITELCVKEKIPMCSYIPNNKLTSEYVITYILNWNAILFEAHTLW